ncbi:queuosine precursor transporter [Serratia sp. JSRIV006]|uniref:queuosine precursor transporter n=1 Tax=Serratia sp. JSRIV006 TaxID=2831896 RepID=UPI001CBCFB4E|nr:queuosine precursor transporter [Serratia sp. JSRIV006]UAN65793.1 queuosine precursor transporter [Serratia sp. JSRIV006]
MNTYNIKYKLIGFKMNGKTTATIMMFSTGRVLDIPLDELVNSEILDDLNHKESREIYRKLYKNEIKTKTIYDIKDRRDSYWMIYTVICIFLTSLFTFCSISGVKIVEVQLLNMIIPAAIFAYPISFILVDILNEFYGLRLARVAILLSFIVNVFFCSSLWLVSFLPSMSDWDMDSEFSSMVKSIISILIASSVSYLVSENVNAYFLYKLKILTNSKYLYLRVLTSTLIASAIDSILFITIAFYGVLSWNVMEVMILTQFIIKTVYAFIGVFPIYGVRWLFNKHIVMK